MEHSFSIDPSVRALGLNGAYLHLENVANRDGDSEFDRLKNEVVAEILRELSAEKIEQDPVLMGFRRLHDAVKCSNRKNVAAPENLLWLLLKNRQLPKVNLLVDIYNLISAKTCLALGAHDLAKVAGDIQLRLTNGSEGFWPLGSAEPKPVRAGEYCYVDGANDVICRLEVRQVEKTKVTTATTGCFYIVQGNSTTPAEKLKAATEELLALTKRFCGGQERYLYCPWA